MKRLKKFVRMSSWVSMGNVAIRQSRLGLRRNGFIVFFLLLVLCFHSFVHAQPGHPYKLSDEMVLDGDVEAFNISPDSSWVVYGADQDTAGVYEIYSVPIGGGTPVKLNDSLAADGDVYSFKISPDSSRVVYRADQDTDIVYELCSVPIGGGTPVKLNGPLVAWGDVSACNISPDSSRVVYLADQDTDEVDELYSVPINGGMPVKLNDSLAADKNVLSRFEISPDSNRVVYAVDHPVSCCTYELYSIPIGGGTPVKLDESKLIYTTMDVFQFEISPDSSRVVYLAQPRTSDVSKLYSIPITGSTSVELNGPLVTGGGVDEFNISPDNSRVVYRADQDTDIVYELYSVPIGGGTPVKLNGPLVAYGDVDTGKISSDSNRVVYQADQDTGGVHELFGVKIKTDTCLGDYEPDGDVDGSDLYHLIIGNLTLTIEEFEMNYGEINCP